VSKTKTALKPTTNTKIESNPLDEVTRLNEQEVRLALAILHKSNELAGVKAARGDLVLDAADQDGAARDAGRQVAVLREEVDSLADAARRARERRIAAIPLVYAAQSNQMETQATALEAEATKLQAESDVLREALQAHDDWSYTVAQPMRGEQMVGGQQGGAPTIVDARGPRHQRLRREAEVLRSQAAQGRFKVAHQAGSLGGDSVEAVISAVHSDAMRIGPSAADIIAFVEQSIGHRTTEKLFIKLAWKAGIIDRQTSRVSRAQSAAVPANGHAPSGQAQTIDSILGDHPVGAQVEDA
jgi:hypothetical protein